MKIDTQEALERYVKQRIPTGDFLRAVLSNDLFDAMGRADLDNRRDLYEICQYVYNDMPSTCWGSPAIVDAWLAKEEESNV
jgi:hypothetical protein